MEKLPRHVDIDYSKYAPDIPEDQLEAYYGLPRHVQFCKECVMSNQKPNSCYEFEHTIKSIKKTMVIQEDGVCDACHACHNKADGHIDWALREKELRELCDEYRKNDGSYDCLVPGSGGKDSFYAAHLLKYKYGMHPLTVTWAPHMYTPWGWDNMQAWIHAGFDNYLCTPNGMTHRLLTRLATENLFHPFQPFILGQKQLAPKMAAKFGIPLVFYGENEAEFGNPIADNNSALRDEHFFAVNDYDHIYLGGVSLRQLEEDYKVDKADLAIYLPSETWAITKNGTRRARTTTALSTAASALRRSAHRAPTPSTIRLTIKSTISSTTPPTSSTASAAPPTMLRRRSETRRSRWTRQRRSAKNLTANTPTASRRRFSSIFRSTAKISRRHPAALSSPRWIANTLCTLPTVSARRICGSGRTVSGSCATPPTRATARFCGATPKARTTKCNGSVRGFAA